MISWRKLQAGLSGKAKPQEAAKQIASTTITQIIEAADTIIVQSIPDASTTVKGKASFNSADFSVSAGAVSILPASETVSGQIEIATIAEIDTGTDSTRAVSPDGLAGSNYGTKVIGVLVEEGATTLGTGDALNGNYFRIPSVCNGWNIVAVAAQVSTVGSTGTASIQLRNITDGTDVLSTKLTIDSGEKDSSTAATAAVIDTNADDVATGDQFTWDIDTVHSVTAPKGLYCEAIVRRP